MKTSMHLNKGNSCWSKLTFNETCLCDGTCYLRDNRGVGPQFDVGSNGVENKS